MTYRKLYRKIFFIDYASSLNISLSDENVLDHDRLFQPSKPTFFSYENSQIKETGRKYKLATWHAVPNKEFPAAFLLDASGYPRSVGTVYFLNDCCRTKFFWIGWTWRLLRLLNNQRHCHLFFRTGKTLSFLVWPCPLHS